MIIRKSVHFRPPGLPRSLLQPGQAQMALLLLIGEFNGRTSKQHEGGIRAKAVVKLVTLSRRKLL